ncbi:MAG TPA: LysO family transporter [Candidatus Sulfomarinibacteraceae bacterium]|nr:LysO family transporter [Candidatus Sulfomarinibacteraceae bacterium]
MTLLVALVAGALIGLSLRGRQRAIKAIDTATGATIFVLLFLLGLSVGGNDTVMQALRQLGWQALVLSLGSVAGSVGLSVILYRRLFQTASAHEE